MRITSEAQQSKPTEAQKSKPDYNELLTMVSSDKNIETMKIILKTQHIAVDKEITRSDNNNNSFLFTSFDKTTLLIEAVKNKATQMVELLLAHDAKIDKKIGYSNSPLRCAVESQNIEMTKLLIRKGAKVNDGSSIGGRESSDVLEYAVKKKYQDMIKVLVEANATLSKYYIEETLEADEDNETLNLEEKCFLIEQKYKGMHLGFNFPGSSNVEDHTPFVIAAYKGNLKDMKTLLQRSANMKTTNNSEKIANQTGNGGTTALMCAAFDYQPHIEVVRFLLDNGANPNQQDREGNTLLHRIGEKWMTTAQDEKLAIAKLLLNKGASTDLTNNKGKTSLEVWTNKNQPQLIAILQFSDKKDPNYQDADGLSQLMHLAKEDDSQAGGNILSQMQGLINQGANINLRDNKNQTALMKACQSKAIETVKFLLERGANIEYIDNQRMTAYHYAIDYNTPHNGTGIWVWNQNPANKILTLLKQHHRGESQLKSMFQYVTIENHMPKNSRPTQQNQTVSHPNDSNDTRNTNMDCPH